MWICSSIVVLIDTAATEYSTYCYTLSLHDALPIFDEAHLFALHGDNGVSRETRKASLETMRDLMCRGRKRGLAGIIATQRLSKLDKNVAAEASNFQIGRAHV